MKDRAAQVESCIKEVHQTIESLARAQDGALLDCMGGCIEGGTSSDSDSSESDSEHSTSQTQSTSCDNALSKPDNPMLLKKLKESKLNWFEFIGSLGRV